MALAVISHAHGADMGQRMIEVPAGAKILSILLKYPLIVAGCVGSMIGSLVVASYQKKNRVQQFLVNASIAICLTPAAFEFTDMEATIPSWLACSLILGIASGTFLKWWIDPSIQASLKHAVAHQIDKHAGGGQSPENGRE